MEEQKNSVKYLQNLHFSRLELTEKVAIKALGCLTPNLIISQPATSRSFSYSRKFNPDIYKKYNWLTRCTEKNALFCYPCLLFGGESPGEASWTKTGVIDLKHLNDKFKNTREVSNT
jgi:hypothetical protein